MNNRIAELVCIVAETRFGSAEHDSLSSRIRAALKSHGITVDRLVLAPPKSLPKTSSGKIQRLALAGTLVRSIRTADGYPRES